MEKIGTVVIEYDEDGKAKTAFFIPKSRLDLVDLNQLKQIDLNSNVQTQVMQHNAETVMANWFSRQNEIELADRNKWEIISGVRECIRREDKSIWKCVIDFYFVDLTKISEHIETIDKEILNLELSDQDFVNAKYIGNLNFERKVLKNKLETR